MSELLPCPFCGSEEAIADRSGEWFSGLCVNCGAVGAADLGKAGAIEKWNTRAAVAERDAAIEKAVKDEREHIATLELAVAEINKAFGVGALMYTHKRKSDDEQYHRSNVALTNAIRSIRARNETKEQA